MGLPNAPDGVGIFPTARRKKREKKGDQGVETDNETVWKGDGGGDGKAVEEKGGDGKAREGVETDNETV